MSDAEFRHEESMDVVAEFRSSHIGQAVGSYKAAHAMRTLRKVSGSANFCGFFDCS
jgi:hypothetical protein